MASEQPTTGTKQEGNPILGCGCLLVILLVIGGIAVSCFGGSDDAADQALPVSPPPTTTSPAVPTTPVPPPSSYAAPAPIVVDHECGDFGSRAEAQAALPSSNPDRLDPDHDGVACEYYDYDTSDDRPDTYVPAPRAPADDDDDDTRPRSGHSGHPCRPGERDGDGDGYCGEGR